MANRRSSSPLSDIRSFEFGSSLPPGALDPPLSIRGYSSSSASQGAPPTFFSSSGVPLTASPLSSPSVAAQQQYQQYPYSHNAGQQRPSLNQYQPPLPPPSPQVYQPRTPQQHSTPPPPSPYPQRPSTEVPSRNSSGRGGANHTMRLPSYDQHGSSALPYDQTPSPQPPPLPAPPQQQSSYDSYSNHAPPHISTNRTNRALPALPPLAGVSSPLPQSPSTQRRRALPTPPAVPSRPPLSYSEHGSANVPPPMTPAQQQYEPPAPGPAPPHQSLTSPSAHGQSSQPSVSRTYTSSTTRTHATGDSFFVNSASTDLTHSSSFSSQYTWEKDPKSMLDYQRPVDKVAPLVESSYQPYAPAQYEDNYRRPSPREEEQTVIPTISAPPHASSSGGLYASSNRGDQTPSPSNGTHSAYHPGDYNQLGIHDSRSRTVSGSDFEPTTPKAMPMRTLDHQRSFTQGSMGAGLEPPTALTLDGDVDNLSNGSTAMQPGRSLNAARGTWNTEWAENARSGYVQTKLLLHQRQTGYDDLDDVYDGYQNSDSEDEEVEEEVNEIRFFNPAFLSETAVQLRDRVVRGHHVKGGITWVGTFTGRDLVTTLQSFLPSFTREGPQDRRFALITARSLQSQLWMVEVDWDDKPIRDSSDVVFKFMSEMDNVGDPLTIALPSGVLTMATKCYAPSCTGDGKCYAPRCPWKTPPNAFLTNVEEESSNSRAHIVTSETDWTEDVDPVVLSELTDEQRNRQTLIRQLIREEDKYAADLDALESVFITPLMTANPPIIEPYHRLENTAQELFGNITEIRRASRRLIDNFAIRLREQAPLILSVGDIVLEAATDFRSLYPEYTDNLTHGEQLLATTVEENKKFADWIERVSKDGDHRWDLRYFLKRPATHLQKYPPALAAILKATDPNDPDYDFLNEALTSIQNISYIAQLKLWQASKGRGPAANLKWYDIVPASVRDVMEKKEFKRQMLIWELIQGEMGQVADLEAIDIIFVEPLRNADIPIIDRGRLDIFIDDAFHNYRSLYELHSRLLEDLQERQVEQHPHFGMISDLIMNAALNWHEAYMEYMPHHPIARAKIAEEKVRNPAFARFLEECIKHPYAARQDLSHFIWRPIQRLMRYELLLKEIRDCQIAVGPPDHPDIEAIPQVIEIIKNLVKAGEKGLAVTEAKVELWHLKTTLDGGKFGSRAIKDLDLLNSMRELIHKGKVYRQPEGTISGAWAELHLLLFDNYFVLVKQSKTSKNKDAPARYTINRRPIPLELFKLGEFSDPAQTRSLGLLKTIRGDRGGGGQGHEETTQSDSRTVYPFTYSFIGQGQLSGQYTLWTDSASARKEWQEKLMHAKVLRDEVNDAGKVFEMTALSTDTFYQAPGYGVPTNGDDYTGRVTFTVDRRSLVAVGCEQGVWIGVRHDPSSLRKVLHVRSVTQIAVLEEFGIFLVLADKSLLAYHLEALVPTAASPQVRSAPQRLSGVRDIVFFSVGQISGRTLVLYMKRKGMDSVFRVLEPILSREPQDARQRRGFGAVFGQRSEWFRVYKDFFIPTEALHVHFLKAKLAIVCAKGFEIMDLTDLKGGAIPIFDPVKQRERPMLAELARQCETAKPLAMFRSTDSEFLLCYDKFGIYVDRHGEPNRDCQAIEWEGHPDSVAFHPPYLLLISPSFIEIRHIDSAKLLQIYTGSDIRCTWDGTGGQLRQFNDAPGPKGWGDEISSQEPRIHICKRTEESSRRTRGIGQHIYELTPTLLLNNPLLNPVHTQDPNYFPPTPLNHRTSMSANSIREYTGYGRSSGYIPGAAPSGTSAGGYPIPPDRQSISSASTTNPPPPQGWNAQGMPGGVPSFGTHQQFPAQPQHQQHYNAHSHHMSDQGHSAGGSGGGGGGGPAPGQVFRQISQTSQSGHTYGGAYSGSGPGGTGGRYPGNYI